MNVAPVLRLAARGRALLLLALVVALPGMAAAQQRGSDEMSASQKRLEEIRRERTQLKEELARLRTQVNSASGELRNIEQQVETSNELLSELDQRTVETETEIQQSTRELDVARNRLLHRKTTLNERLRAIYKRGPLHTPQVLLTASSFGDLLSRYKYLYLIAQRDRALMSEVAELEAQLLVRDRRLRRSLIELQTLQIEKSQENAAMHGLEEQRRRALATAQGRQRTTDTRYRKLAEDEKRLRSLIATLEKKRKEAERLAAERKEAERLAAARKKTGSTAAKAASTRAAPTDVGLSTKDLGNLGWPVEGKLIYRFGRSVQPNGTAVRMNGIGLAAPVGSPVRSVDGGTVVMAGPFESYGPTVVLSHGAGYYSLYLYLSKISVTEGVEVERGQTLGAVGGAGTGEGPHIEFQIRAPGGAAVDPLAWLRKRAG